MKPLRILQVVGGMNTGGTETWLMHVLRHIDRNRYQMDFLVHRGAEGAYDREIKDLGSRLIPCTQISRPWAYARDLQGILERSGPYDVVHTHVNYFSGLALRVAARAGIPGRVSHSHTDTLELSKSSSPARRGYVALMKRWIHRYATCRLAVSERAGVSLFGAKWRSDGRGRLLYPAVDLAPFHSALDSLQVRKELSLPGEAFVIGHTGRFTEPKNHAFLVDVFAEVARRDDAARLLLIGDGPLKPEIQRRVDEAGLAPRVVFAGVRSDVPRLLAAMDVFLFPSLYEGLGLALVEAQAAGVAGVYSDAVPPEAEVIPALLYRLSLSDGAARWADTVLGARATANIPSRSEALSRIESSPFNITNCLRKLSLVYEAEARQQRQPKDVPSPVERGAL